MFHLTAEVTSEQSVEIPNGMYVLYAKTGSAKLRTPETSHKDFRFPWERRRLGQCRGLFEGTRPKGRLRSAAACCRLKAWIDANYCNQLGNS